MYRLLIVDDDQELCSLLTSYLSQEGFEVTSVHDGGEAAARIRSADFDLIVLDVMLPTMNGFDVLRDIRRQKSVPVLMLTAKGEEIDRIVGLEMGADDYLAKPCNPRELVARIRSIIRRAEAMPPQLDAEESKDLTLLDLTIEVGKRIVSVNDEVIELTATEFQILLLLADNAGELVKRESISEECLGRKLAAFDRSIDMHISHLRKKLGAGTTGEERIKTIRGVGYQYVAI
ncbi:response regulator transcription factor [Pleionea sp. CnH1-48]|uniref:response regulator transcription factor n=1 Tax=Pleionea sp. CnH1-48 TaxID=2954494 RepID=UPI0020977904|nr:response regulator transcription factor [Pleionea sp. CnH1-48]MCO7225703.1 response regulator transcription factor [Pleionea sp. CnH1-48]